MVKVDVSIDGKIVKLNEGENLLKELKSIGYNIPHLCYYERLLPQGKCRLCVVEIEGARNLVTACTAIVQKDMSIKTHSQRVIESRKTSLQLILSNHNLECTICSSNLTCKLQKYAEEFGLKELRFPKTFRKEFDDSSCSIVRDESKCILCGRCYGVCNDIQSVYAIGLTNRGFDTIIKPPFSQKIKESNCIGCGQCVVACPTGALSIKSDIEKVIKALDDETKHVVVQTAPSVRVALGEALGMKAGSLVTGKMVTALKRLGFNKVFDTDFAADLTIVEEATEFIDRFVNNKNLPLITSCCPGWVNFAEKFYPNQLKYLSSCKSPQAMLSSVIKNIYAKENNLKKENIVVVDIMPCTAKKYEAERDEFNHETDYVLTTVELAKLIKQRGLNFEKLDDSKFDNPLGESTGAGVIFGRSGGVMEAALRTSADLITGKNLKEFEYTQIRGNALRKDFSVKINEHKIEVCAIHTLGEARKVMDEITAGKCKYDFIEIMACYGGCIGGGGQPRYEDESVLLERFNSIKKEDEGKKIRKSHLNPEIKKLYDKYFDGQFGSKKAHHLLHTQYFEKYNL